MSRESDVAATERLAQAHAEVTELRRKATLATELALLVLETESRQTGSVSFLARQILGLLGQEPQAPQTEGPTDG